MAGFLDELEADGRAVRIELPRQRRSRARWVADGGGGAVSPGVRPGRRPTRPRRRRPPRRSSRRFLDTHALVGLDDVLARYPFERDWARAAAGGVGRQRAGWSPVPPTESRAAAVVGAGEPRAGAARHAWRSCAARWSTCPPPQFADFVLRWQGAAPGDAARRRRGAGRGARPAQGLPLPAELWEQTVLPAPRAGLSAALARRVDRRRRLDAGSASGGRRRALRLLRPRASSSSCRPAGSCCRSDADRRARPRAPAAAGRVVPDRPGR